MFRAGLRRWHYGGSHVILSVANIDMLVGYLTAPLPEVWSDVENTREEVRLREINI